MSLTIAVYTYTVVGTPDTAAASATVPPMHSLNQILITIPPQGQQTLDQKISDIHLAEIARTLTNWESVCPNLGITEPEEEAIKEENARSDARRYVVLFPFR